MESGWQLARYAFRNGSYGQAAKLYARVLAQAYARDDPAAIGDIGYEYALSLLRGGDARAAAEQAQSTRAELERRKANVFAELVLVEAVALYKSGRPAAARSAAMETVRLAGDSDPESRVRAQFILGMIAADEGDEMRVGAALASMGMPSADALKADRAELMGRRMTLAGDAKGAISSFEEAAVLRRDLRDYDGMARALAAAGAAAEKIEDPAQAADLYYRAGRSAAAQSDPASARTWLTRASELAAQSGLDVIEAEAQDQLRALED